MLNGMGHYCIDTEADALELLEEIVTLLVTIKGLQSQRHWWKYTKQQQTPPLMKNPSLFQGLKKPGLNNVTSNGAENFQHYNTTAYA